MVFLNVHFPQGHRGLELFLASCTVVLKYERLNNQLNADK